MSKSFSLDYVLSLSEERITADFPHGLVMHGKRWIPADQDSEGLGHRSLRQLMQEKRRRLLKDRFLESNPGMARRDYTDRTDRAMRDEGAAIPADLQARYSDEARERFEKQQKPLSQRVAELERKVGPNQLASLRKRVESLERATHEEAA